MVEFDIARKYDVAPRSFDDDAHTIGYRVSDPKESYGELAELENFTFLDFADGDGGGLSKFFLSLLDHHACELAGVDGRIAHTIEDIRDAADVIEVAVGDEQAADVVAAFFEVAGVGQDVIDTGRVLFGAECEARIDDEDVVANFDRGHVAADFLYSAEWHDTHYIGCGDRDGHCAAWCVVAIGRGMMRDVLLTSAWWTIRRSTKSAGT